MIRRSFIGAVAAGAVMASAVWALLASSTPAAANAVRQDDARPEITVWLMPNEPAARLDPTLDIDRFNKELEELSVVVENTTDDYLRQQLLRWNPDFAIPEWPIIKGQMGTLRALGAFADKHGVRVRVRIVTWATAFQELQDALDKKGRAAAPPDVAQIGSTWVAHFQNRNGLVRPADSQLGGLEWRTLPGTGNVTLRYIHDIRLLFYWKKLPDDPPDTPAFEMNAKNWQTIVDSLKSAKTGKRLRHGPPMAMPIGYGVRLLHDYAPLTWAGGGIFLESGSKQIDLVSEKALAVPTMLSRESVQFDDQKSPYRIIAFPDMSHEETLSRHFILGRYRAVIEPLAFLRRWKTDFDRMKNESVKSPLTKESAFWDYYDVAVPPTPFKGGSDLMVVAGTRRADLSFQLAHFLASSNDCLKRLAEYGHLPAQEKRTQFGIAELLKSIDAPAAAQDKITGAIKDAVDKGREYPRLEQFATDAESPEAQEAMQRLWRRIAEGGANDDRITKAAQKAQDAINVSEIEQQKRLEREKERIAEEYRTWLRWLYVAGGMLLVSVVFLVAQIKAMKSKNHLLIAKNATDNKNIELLDEKNRVLDEKNLALTEKNRVLDELKKVRCFSATALAMVDSVHNFAYRPSLFPDVTDEQQTRALMIRAGLRGWRRGSDFDEWAPERLQDIAWRAILLSINYVNDPEICNRWDSKASKISEEHFLRSEQLIRNESDWKEEKEPFHFDVCCSDAVTKLPWMLEHYLTCLLTNAIKASRIRGKGRAFRSIKIAFDGESLVVSNDVDSGAKGMSEHLSEILNMSETIGDFERAIQKLFLERPTDDWPGIGLVEAFCIAKLCFGSMTVTASPPLFSLRLRP